jgi:hypothetical protein
MSAMSSAWAFACADDGLCLLHDRHLSAEAHCDKFMRLAPMRSKRPFLVIRRSFPSAYS